MPSQEKAEPAAVSVIVVNHDRRQLLADCLDSLLRQSLTPLEILVVDNGSRDGSQQYLRDLKSPLVRLLELPSNLGFAAANNRALKVARGEFIALLNNDAVAESKWLERLIQPLRSDPCCGMCASKILLEGGIIDKVGHLLFLDGQNRGRGTGEPDRGQYDQSQEVLLPDGCAAAYRRELLHQVGGFDEDFFAYADDADLGLRARWLGWSCQYVPGAVVVHRQSATTSRYSPQKIFWVERNRCWLAAKNFPWFVLLAGPFLTLYRWSWNLAAALRGRGAAGQFRRQGGWGGAATTVLRANWEALRRLPTMLRKRSQVRRSRKLSDWEFFRLIWKYRIRARELAFQDPEKG